jgi:hypothetical protein
MFVHKFRDKFTDGKSLLHDIPTMAPLHHQHQPAKEAKTIFSVQVAQFVVHEVHRRWWHIWQMVTDLIFEKVQCSQDQRPESSIFLLELLDLDVVPLVLPPLLLLLPPPKLFELAVLLHAPWESTSDRPFSRARTKFSK